jgi:glucan phosphorylase
MEQGLKKVAEVSTAPERKEGESTARTGKFSSDHTILEYANDIWDI